MVITGEWRQTLLGCALERNMSRRQVVQRKLENKIGSRKAAKQSNDRSAWRLAHGTCVPDIMLKL